MDTRKAQELIDKHQKGTLSPEEETMLEGWYLQLTSEQKLNIPKKHLTQKKKVIWRSLQVNQNLSKVVKFGFRIQVAAAIVIIAIGGIFYFNQKSIIKQSVNRVPKNDIGPGGNVAYLTLANGKKIALNNTSSGQIANQAGTSVTKTSNGMLVYTLGQKSPLNTPSELNTIATPHGGQWQVLLPDGTKVWLNAASSLTYPVSFASLKNRKVELEGEAYFQVAKDKAHPFIVHTLNQDVQVLGTHFNVNAYADEKYTKTTLLEGSVKVSAMLPANKNNTLSAQILKPGQQSVLNNGVIKISTANTDAAIAWKNAIFLFDNDNLEDIMRRIARWYDASVTYQNDQIKQELFSGRISRSQNVSEVLKMLSLTGAAKFKIEGRKIIITN